MFLLPIVIAIAVSGLIAIVLIMFSVWLGSRETVIDPIVSEGARK